MPSGAWRRREVAGDPLATVTADPAVPDERRQPVGIAACLRRR